MLMFFYDDLLDEEVRNKLKLKAKYVDDGYAEANVFRISFRIRYPLSYTWSRYVLVPLKEYIRKSSKKVYGSIYDVDPSQLDIISAYLGSSRFIIGYTTSEDLVDWQIIKIHSYNKEWEIFTYIANQSNPDVSKQITFPNRRVRGKNIFLNDGLRTKLKGGPLWDGQI